MTPDSDSESCLFCRILSLEIPASFVYEDKLAVAFLDIHPQSEGHTLVIPRAHHARFTSMPAELAAHLFTVAHRVLGGIQRSEILSEGANLVMNDGEAAGQEVLHAHLHVIPRTTSVERHSKTDRDALEATAKKIRTSIVKEKSKDPLAGMSLEKILNELVDQLGWEVLGQEVPINCFIKDPSLGSSLKFLRKTDWARKKVEHLYVEYISFKAERELGTK